MTASASRSVVLEVESLEERRVLSSTSFVNGLYQVLLQRAAAPSEVTPWVNQLNTGALTPVQVALLFTRSTEFRTNLVVADYQNFLGRTPSGSEVSYWVGALQKGLNSRQMEVQFLASPEFYQNHGATSKGWVNGVFEDVLGRAADPNGLAWAQQAIQNGTSLQVVALDIVQSPESLQRIVTAAFGQVLGRTPDSSGLAYWAANLANGMTATQLEAVLAGSSEFIVDHGGMDPIVRPVPVAVPVPVDSFVYDPFVPAPFLGYGGTFTSGGFTGGFSGGFSGGSAGSGS